MAKEEIIAGLKNALDRGQSLESAAQSFISAGYAVEDVREAVNAVNMGVLSSVRPSQQQNFIQQKVESAQVQQTFQSQKQESEQPKKAIPKWVIVTGALLLFVIIFIILMTFLGESLLEMWFGK